MSRAPVLVTGGSGFLGGHLVRALREHGEEVRVLCREPAEELAALGARLVPGDLLAPDAEQLVLHAAAGCERVYHLAGLVSRNPDKARAMMRLHVEGTRTLLLAAARAGVRRVLLASTSGTIAISRQPEPIADESFPYPIEVCGGWPYYLSKIYKEKLAFGLADKLGLELVVVNPSLLLGPGDRRGSSTMDVRRFLGGEIPFIPPGGLSLVDVRDVAPACIAAMERGRDRARYLLGGPNWTFAEFFGRLGRVARLEGPWLRLPARWGSAAAGLAGLIEDLARRAGHDAPVERISVEMGQCFFYCDSSLARRELGFDPRDPQETLFDTVSDLRKTLAPYNL